MKNSKTAQAIAWVIAEPGRSQYRAAQLFKVSQSAISIGMRTREENAALWKEYGARIEAGDTRGIPHKTILRAMRGRDDVLHIHAPILSRTQQALDYMSVTGCSAVEAAEEFQLQAATLYPAQKRERYFDGEFDRYGAPLIDALAAHVTLHPDTSPEKCAHLFGIKNASHAAMFLQIRETRARRAAMRAGGMVSRDPVQVMQQRCATLARMVGGEAGEGIAQAIEALQ